MNGSITPSINYSLRQLTIGKILSIFQLLHWTSDIIWAVSRENLFMPYVNNKGADQPAHPKTGFLVTRLISSHLLLDPAPWRSTGHHRWRCNNSEWVFPPFRLLLPSESHQTPFLILSSHFFFCFPLLFVPFFCPLQNSLRHARRSWDVAIPSEFPFLNYG